MLQTIKYVLKAEKINGVSWNPLQVSGADARNCATGFKPRINFELIQ